MKKRKMALVCMAVLLVFGFSLVLAEDYDYSATKCRNYFTTHGSVTKESDDDWDYVLVVATSGGITFTPALPAGERVRQEVCAIGGSGVELGRYVPVYPGFTGGAMGGWYSVPVTRSDADEYDVMRVRISNPYGNSYNMKTSGTVRVNWR